MNFCGRAVKQFSIPLFVSEWGALRSDRSTTIDLDYHLHYETGLFVDEFDGNGKPDLAELGDTRTGVGAGGPAAGEVELV